MSRGNPNRHLMRRILKLLDLLKGNHIELDQLLESEAPELLLPSADPLEVRAACEILAFMDEMPGGFLIYYADGDEEIIYANRGLLQIFQCDTLKEFRELTGNSFQGVVHPDDLEEVERSIRLQVAASQYDLDYVEYRVACKDGAIRWIEDYGHFIRNEPARDVFYVFLGDATEKQGRRQLERELIDHEKQQLLSMRQSYDEEWAQINQEYLRRLNVIEGLSVNYDSILYADLDDDMVLPYRLSSRIEALFEKGPRPKRFNWYFDTYLNTKVHPDDREMLARETAPEYIREKLSHISTYYINYRAVNDGVNQFLQLRIVDVGHKGHVSPIVMGCRSMDEEIQHELRQKELLAEALNNASLAITAKNTFLSNMSHDMRTPLNAIFGFTALARQSIRDPEALQTYLNRVERSGHQLLDLIDKVLNVSWSGSNEATALEDECGLCEIIQEVYDFLSPQAMEKDIDFSLDCSGVLHDHVFGDPEKLNQLVMYLANNALTYTKPGGRVSIVLTEQEELPNYYASYQMMITDTGIGISQEFLARMFEPFTREQNTTLSGIHGIGLGLTIAKNIVDRMGGTIDVKSSLNEGTSFTVNLKFRFQPDLLPPAAGSGFGGYRECRKLLLVEDNEINLEIETALLEDLGFSIEPAENGSIAVEKMKQAAPGDYDVVLMDIQMPVMNGWEAAKAIRRLENPALAATPIIALSANVFESDIQKSIESGMNAHLTKPLDIPRLLKVMEEAVLNRK